jgi:hypothetical protein
MRIYECHVEVAEPTDDVREGNLDGRVTAVAAGTVDLRRAHPRRRNDGRPSLRCVIRADSPIVSSALIC